MEKKLAKKCPPPTEIESGKIIGGFAHNQVLALADKVVEAVKSGAIKRFVVMAGCDGRQKSRNYYTEVAKALPNDTVILTAGILLFLGFPVCGSISVSPALLSSRLPKSQELPGPPKFLTLLSTHTTR